VKVAVFAALGFRI